MQALIYTRTSSVSDRQNNERQVVDLMKYATANNIEVVKCFNEKISGAKHNSEREVFKECLSYAERNSIKLILCNELSRWGRSIWDVLEGIKYCIDRSINVFFQKENLNVLKEDGTVDGIMAIYISCLSFCAAKERENIKFRLNSGRQLAIEQGRCTLGRKVGSIKSKEKKKEEYGDIIKCLRKGYSVASTYAICKEKGVKCSVSTVKRVKKEFASEIKR